MKVGIVGSRKFNDYEFLKEKVLEIVPLEDISMVVSGGAEGADALGERFSREVLGIEPKVFKPDFSRGYHVREYFIRNWKIADACDILTAFKVALISKGTDSTISYAKKLGKKVYILYSF